MTKEKIPEEIPELVDLLLQEEEIEETGVLAEEEEKEKEKETPTGRAVFIPTRIESPEISLMPSTVFITPHLIRQRLIHLAIFAIIYLFLSLFLWQMFHILKNTFIYQTKAINEEIKIIEKEVQTILPFKDEINLLDQKAVQIKKMLDGHIYWSKFLNFLDQKTLNGVTITDFSLDTSGKLIVPAQTDKFINVNLQLEKFLEDKELIKGASVSNARSIPEGVSFTINLDLTEKAFRR